MNNIIEILSLLETSDFRSDDGSRSSVSLLKGLTVSQIAEFQKRFPKPIPQDIVELLMFSAGLEIPRFERISFVGNLDFAFEEVSPLGIPLATDGIGNFWLLDIEVESGRWGSVFFVSHDPPVLLLQAFSLRQFLNQILDCARDGSNPFERIPQQTEKVYEPKITEKLVKDFGDKTNPELYDFVKKHSEQSIVIDLRKCSVGDGFTIDKEGFNSEIARFGSEMFFIIKLEKRRMFSWLFL